MAKKKKIYIAIQVWFMIFLTILLSPLLTYIGDRPKYELKKIVGKVVSVSDYFDQLAGKRGEKYRYIGIDNYHMPFQLFVGKDKFDLTPDLDRIDSLKVGDSISIYVSRNIFTAETYKVNKGVYFIDSGTREIFIRGNGGKTGTYIVIGFIALAIGLLYIFKRT